MCISKDKAENPIIQVGEKSNKSKYDFLRMYYTKWNQIIKSRPRVIIDTHAGSGIVELLKNKSILGNDQTEFIYE